jgi:outer membrane protein OmpA-like peptidoglycan-associated protein
MCHFYLNEFKDGLDYFEAVQSGSLKKKHYEYYFGYGMTRVKLGEYESALKLFTEFSTKGKLGDINYFNIIGLISMCNYAIENKEKPVSALVETLGDSINSKYNDYHPAVSADGKTFMFTSGREDSRGSILTSTGDYKSDVYVSNWKSQEEEWSEAKPIEGALNSDDYDANGSVSGDGTGIYVYRNTAEENKKILSPTGGGDIYFSKKGPTGRWSAPKLIEGVNTTSYEGCPSATPDGKKLFFVSARSGIVGGRGAQGGWDIWLAEKLEDGTWDAPKNLGPTVNTPYDERNIFIHPNGKTLFFASDGYSEKSFGGFDIYKTELVDGKWTEPVNLGYPINTQFNEREFSVSTDGKVGWLAADRDIEKKDYDIYEVDMKHYNVFTGKSSVLSILKGKVTDALTGLPMKVNISITEKGEGTGEVFNSGDNGSYFNTLIADKTYVISIEKEGYKKFTKEIFIKAPAKKPVSKRKTSKRKKSKKTTETQTVELDFEIQRTNSFEVVSKDLFSIQYIAFNKTESGFEINEFSKNILEMFIKQCEKAPSIKLDISGHFEESEDANLKSKDLADLVVNFLKEKGVKSPVLKVNYRGDAEPLGDNDTEEGRTSNRRVEVKILL